MSGAEKRPWTDEERARLAELQQQGWTLTTIASELGRTKRSVVSQAEEQKKRQAATESGKRFIWRQRLCPVCQAEVFNDETTDFRRCLAHRGETPATQYGVAARGRWTQRAGGAA